MPLTIVRVVVGSIALATGVMIGRASAPEDAAPRPATAPSASTALAADDTLALSHMLAVARGVDPLLCELATRSVDMHGWWSHWGPMGGDPLEVDSASAALIAWIQRRHADPAVIPRLRAGLHDSDACVRRLSGSFLGRVEHPRALAELLAALDDPSADTRRVAALGLGLRHDDDRDPAMRQAVEPLLKHLRDDAPAVRRAAAWALGSMEASAAVQPLIDLLGRDPDPRVRQAAAWAIGEIRG